MLVSVKNSKFAIQCHYDENERVAAMPSRKWRKEYKLWACPASFDNAMYLRTEFSRSELTDDAAALVQSIIQDAVPKPITDVMPASILDGLMPHQQDAIKRAWYDEGFAILHRPRCRKTATTIRLACGRAMAGQITRLVVFAPNSIKAVWQSEFEKRAVCPYDLHVFEADKKNQYQRWLEYSNAPLPTLRVLVVSIEGMSGLGGIDAVMHFIREHRETTMAVVDESTRISNHKANRTKAMWDIGAVVRYRIILTGSEVTRDVENLFAQFRFLGIHVFGFDSFYAWRNRYCMMGGYNSKKIVGTHHTRELMNKIAAHAHLVRTTDIVKMPEKTFTQRIIRPSTEQVEIIRSLQRTLEAEHEGREITVQSAMVAQLRALQVAGGHFPAAEDDGTTTMIPLKANPKLAELMALLDEEPSKVVIWARFIPEIRMIQQAIADRYGSESVVTFHGDVRREERFEITQRFQTDPAIRYIVANAQTAGMGIELSAADLMVYFSSDYTYENRIQSLERATNLDKLIGIGVVDLVLDIKADRNVIYSMSAKKDLAEYVENAIHSHTFSLI